MVDLAVMADNFRVFANNAGMADTKYITNMMDFYSIVNYLPAAIGITIARLLRLGMVPLIYLGKIFSSIFYLSLGYRAVRRTPAGKLTLSFILLLPCTMMMSAAYTYDSAVLIITVSWIASLLLIKKEYSLGNLAELLVWSFLFGAVKGGGYLILLPILFIITGNKECAKKHTMLITTAVSLLSLLIFDRLLPDDGLFQLEAAGSDKLSSIWAIQNPLGYIKLVISTYIASPDMLILNIGGSMLGWLEPGVIPYTVLSVMYIFIFLNLLVEQRDVSLTNADRICFLLTSAAVFIAVPAMLLRETSAGDSCIQGMQSRYFLPALFPALLGISSGKLSLIKDIRKDRLNEISYFCVRAFAWISVISILYMSRLYLTR